MTILQKTMIDEQVSFYLNILRTALNSKDREKKRILYTNRSDLQSKLESDRYDFAFVTNDNQEDKDTKQGSNCFTLRIYKWMDITERNIAERETKLIYVSSILR